MAFDGLVINGVVKELENTILNSRIEKIYQPTSDEILFKLYGNSNKYNLQVVISSDNYRLNLTKYTKSNPSIAPNFCMVLRKYLASARIRKIYTTGLERIVFIDLDSMSEEGNLEKYTLIIELMGKHSNVILVNSNNVIINSLKHFKKDEHSYRNILPGYTYESISSDKYDITLKNDFDYFYNNLNLNDEATLDKFITNNIAGISNTFANYSIEKLNISKDISKENIKVLYYYILDLSENIKDAVCIDTGNDYTIEQSSSKSNLQINNFIDEFYNLKESNENFISYRNNLLKLIFSKLKKLESKLFNINKKLIECNNMETYKLYGELIVNNLYKIDKTHLDNITLNNYYTNEEITIPLDKSLTPYDNAQKYFKKYNKLKNAMSIVKDQEDELQQQITYLESIVYELENASTSNDIDDIYDEISNNVLIKNINIKKEKNVNVKQKRIDSRVHKFTKDQFIRFKVDEFDVFVGKNNVQNDYLTLKFASDNDLWFHTKDIHGSHVILRIQDKQPSQEIINKVASIAAKYSKAKLSSNVPVDYTYVKYVKKPNKVKPGMVIYTHEQTVNVQPEK